MEFIEIEAIAREQRPLNVEYPENYVISAHYALSDLYKRFHSLMLPQEKAVIEKQKIKYAYNKAREEREKYIATCGRFADQIKVSDEFRCKLHKAINGGEDLMETFLLACTCIAVLTGDDTLRGSKVAQQMSMDYTK